MIKFKIYILIIIVLIVGVDFSYSQDVTSPDIPVLDSVTVNQSTLKINIGWQFSNATDVKGYIIYKKNAFWLALDTVNSTTSFYEDIVSNPYTSIESYRIAAFDSSYNISPMTNPHTSIYANTTEKTLDCKIFIEINWSDYEGWDNLSIYNVLRKTNNGIVTKIGETTDSYYNDFAILNNTSYCYYIQAVSTDNKTSQSNKTCFFTELSSNNKFINADYVTVKSYDYVEISFTIDTLFTTGDYYMLYRSTNNIVDFTELDTIKSIEGNKIISYDNININKDKCYYKLELYNACDLLLKTSKLAENIILDVKQDANLIHKLTWTPYQNWLGEVKEYNIYRFLDDQEPVLIGTSMDETYIDNAESFLTERVEGNFCYFIEAIEGISPYEPVLDSIRKSRSNISCATQSPIVFIPTAFMPYDAHEINRIFKPIISFASPKDYRLIIYDRWGQLVWQTNNSQEGWDGKTTQGSILGGTFAYVLSFTSAENEFITYKGNITVIY